MATFDSRNANTNNKRKRTKENDESIISITGYQPSFLLYHLKMLRVLYVENDGGLLTDGAVSEEVWGMVGRFLERRSDLTRTQQRAHRWRIIVEEAKAVSLAAAVQQESTDPMEFPASPPGKRLFASPASCSKNAIKEQSLINQGSSPRSSVAVAWLLKQRALVEEEKAKRDAQPFFDLYAAVCQRAQRLTTILQSSDDDETISNLPSQDEARETRMELDAKQRLWKMLANDLYHVIKID